jgi:hypothetical protein
MSMLFPFRILFPFLSNEDKNLSCYGHSKTEESLDSSSDPDDYVSIDSGKVCRVSATERWPDRQMDID